MKLRWLLSLVAMLGAALPWALVDAQPVPPVPPAPAAPQPAPEAAVSTLRLHLVDNGWTLDPHYARDAQSFLLCGALYDSLYSYTPGPAAEIRPALAEDFPAVTDNGLTWTIKLRKDARFHNSGAVFGDSRSRTARAQDVVASLKRLAAAGPDDSMYWLIKGIVVGLDDYGDQAAAEERTGTDDIAVAGLAAPDDHTLVLKLTRPFGALLSTLAHPCTSVVPVEAIDTYGAALSGRAVGTGAYRLHAIGETSLLVLKRFDGHWGDKPAFERILFQRHENSLVAFDAFAQGRIDRCPVRDGASLKFLMPNDKPGPLLQKAGVEPHWMDEAGMYFMAFNMEDPVWGANDNDGRLLRKAVSQAFDRAAMQTASGHAGPWGRAAEEAVPQGTEHAELARAHALGSTDAKAAEATLAASKYKGGKNPATGEPLVLELVTQANAPMHRALGTTLKASLQPLGITVVTRAVRGDYRQVVRADSGSAFFGGWFLDFPDTQNFLQLLYGPNAGLSEEFNNLARYKSGEFDRLYKEFEGLLPVPANSKRRGEQVDAMFKLLEQDRPVMPLFMRRECELRSTRVAWPQLPRATYAELRHIKPARTE